ncbi:membrane steroid-binding protein 2-like [Salvia splendens]|uniref:membrane steroid-binding protein 2-like n=1 Tax=Salvia splendens TaxID=180675 RepID=UPI001C27D2E6|nr:membrane steroid-binding protein 2-like [Salvia splendens]
MAIQLWETVKESITTYTGLPPATFFTVLALGLTLYYVLSTFFGSSDGGSRGHDRSRASQEQMEPLPLPVQLGEVTAEELKLYDGSDSKKPLLMAIKGQIYDVTQSRMFYGPGGPYALFVGKDASRALAKMSFEDKDLNGDLTGLGVFEMEALQDWEYKFMSKYVKVGTVKATIPVNDGATESEATHVEAAEGHVAKPAEDGPSETVPKETEETTTAAADVDVEKKE